jgi:hypothetical protein
MADFDLRLTRRSALVAMASLVQARVAFAAEEPSITCSRHADRLARDGGRQARKIRCGSVRAGWAADVREFYRRTERLSGSPAAKPTCSGG